MDGWRDGREGRSLIWVISPTRVCQVPAAETNLLDRTVGTSFRVPWLAGKSGKVAGSRYVGERGSTATLPEAALRCAAVRRGEVIDRSSGQSSKSTAAAAAAAAAASSSAAPLTLAFLPLRQASKPTQPAEPSPVSRVPSPSSPSQSRIPI